MADRLDLSAAEWRERAVAHAWALRVLLAVAELDPTSMRASFLRDAAQTLRAANAEGVFRHVPLPILFPDAVLDDSYEPTEAAAEVVKR